MIKLGEIFSASASYVSRIRCRRIACATYLISSGVTNYDPAEGLEL